MRQGWLRIVASLGLFLTTSSIVAAPEARGPMTAVHTGNSFFDGFDRIDAGRWYISDGWTNGDHQACTWSRDNISVSNGVMRLLLAAATDNLRPYRCAEIRTNERLGFGLYEARIRTAGGSGLNSAMFTYSGPPLTPVHDEIDFEFLGKAPGTVQLNYYIGARGGHESLPTLGYDATAGFHDYAFDWSARGIKWYIDGRLVRESNGPALPAMPGQFFLSLWSGTKQVDGWLGAFDPSKAPAVMEVDWIAFTREGENCRFARSVSCLKTGPR
jgi:endo-1,3-1,4-beta-glycanase ExoK